LNEMIIERLKDELENYAYQLIQMQNPIPLPERDSDEEEL